MRTGLDDKDWCRGEEEERKGKNLAAIDQKIARQLGMARAFAETLTRHGRRSAIQERGKVGRFLSAWKKFTVRRVPRPGDLDCLDVKKQVARCSILASQDSLYLPAHTTMMSVPGRGSALLRSKLFSPSLGRITNLLKANHRPSLSQVRAESAPSALAQLPDRGRQQQHHH